MGIWDCLKCWNTFPKSSPESYETRDNIIGENCEFDILVEKLIVIGVPYPVLCPGTDIDDRCCARKFWPKKSNPKLMTHCTEPICSFQAITPDTVQTCRAIMSKEKKKIESSEDTTETTEDDEADEQPEEDNETDNTYVKSVISRSSHRSELNDERSLVNDAIKINQTASGAGIVVPNPQNYEEQYYRDFILKYGTIFTENAKHPIPKDPNPVNPSNIVKIKPLVIPLIQPSTSQKKEFETKVSKQDKITPVWRTKHKNATQQNEIKNTKQDVSEIELSSIDAEAENDESYTSEVDQCTQMIKVKPGFPTLKLNPEQTQNFAIAHSSFKVTTSSEAQQMKNDNQTEKIAVDSSKDMGVEGTSDNHRGKKALRWKIIIRHQAPSTEQAEVMTDNKNSDQNTKDTTKDSSSSDSGYLHYDYVDE